MLLSIDFGTRNLHIVEGRVTGRTVEIKRAAVEPGAPGAISDGLIKDHAGLEVSLRSALARKGFKTGGVVLTVNSSHVFQKELELPQAKPKDLADMVRFEMLTSMGSGKDMVVEFVQAGETKNAEGTKLLKIRAAALLKETIADYFTVLKNVKLGAVAFDIHQNAVTKLFSGASVNGRKLAGRSALLVDLGATTSTVYIFRNDEFLYSRLLPIGDQEIDRFLSQRRAAADSSGRSATEPDFTVEALRADAELADAVRPYFNAVSDGITRIIQYQKARVDDFIAEDILLFGGAAKYPGIDSTLASILGQSVETIASVDRIKAPPGVRISDFINAAGAMIRLD